MDPIKEVSDILIEEIIELYEVENRLLQILPRMAKAATDRSLKTAIGMHLEQTKEQIKHLKQAISHLVVPNEKNYAARAVTFRLAESNEWDVISHSNQAMDASLICAAMKIEHYKTASYVNVCTFANLLGWQEIAAPLEAALAKHGPIFFKRLTTTSQAVIAADAVGSTTPPFAPARLTSGGSGGTN